MGVPLKVILSAARRRRASLAVAAALGTSLASASAASANTNYCGILTPPHTACSSSITGHYYINTATYTGAGTVGVCEKATWWNGSTYVLVTRRCANNHVQSDSDLFDLWNSNDWVNLYVGNDSANNHTINGIGSN
jgi:hypothetical protein